MNLLAKDRATRTPPDKAGNLETTQGARPHGLIQNFLFTHD